MRPIFPMTPKSRAISLPSVRWISLRLFSVLPVICPDFSSFESLLAKAFHPIFQINAADPNVNAAENATSIPS